MFIFARILYTNNIIDVKITMSTYRELVYMVLDEVKLSSDDSTFTEDHIIFLLNKYRAFLLKQKYSDIKKKIPESNYQTICLDLIEVPPIEEIPCVGNSYLRSVEKIPFLIPIGISKVYPVDYYQGEITYVSRDRMKYTGYNKYLQNIIYCSLGPDNYLYFKSNNPQFLYLEKVKFTGLFEDPSKIFNLKCNEEGNNPCDVLDAEFPLEEGLISPLLELVIKTVLGGIYKPEDDKNNANDDLSNLANFIRGNVKSNLQKQMEE